MLHRKTPEQVDIGCSSSIDMDRTHISVSSRKGVIKLQVPKHQLWNAGQCLLPKHQLRPTRLPKATVATLRGYFSEKSESRNLIRMMFSGRDWILKAAKKTTELSAAYEMRETLQIMWLGPIKNSRVRSCPSMC